jgi:hypothetical protein
MASTGIYVEGLRETSRALEKAGVDVEDLKDVMGAIATEASNTLAPLLPRHTGRLAGSTRPNRAKGKAVVTIGGARVPYAAPILYGWPKRHIRPSVAIPRTDAVMEVRAPEMLEDGWNAIAEKNGLI